MKIMRIIMRIISATAIFMLFLNGCTKPMKDDFLSSNGAVSNVVPPDSWLGTYSFYEFCEPNINMVYDMEIFKEKDNYYAHLYIDGFQTMARIKAKVLGGGSSINLIFDSYLAGNQIELFCKDDVLFSLKKENTDILTEWRELNPILPKNEMPNKVCFTKNDSTAIGFVDEETFEIIKEAYSKIDFYGGFEKGNIEAYDFYKKKYLTLLNCETTFFDKQRNKEFYINEFSEMDFTIPGMHSTYLGEKDKYDVNNYIYYFFDVDGDDIPELCISDEIRFVYILKYDASSDSFILWHEIDTTWIHLLGSKQLWFYSGMSPMEYAYFELDQDGREDLVVRFRVEGYYNTEAQQDDVMYMVTFPEFVDENKNINLPENTKIQGATIGTQEGLTYFRITKEQWDELTSDFFEARQLSGETIKEVRFAYEELFGGY